MLPLAADWNPQMDLQAQARAHRMGQTREVRRRWCVVRPRQLPQLPSALSSVVLQALA